MKYHSVNQNTIVWDEMRQGRITASNFDVIEMKPSTKGYRQYAFKIAYERIFGCKFPDKWNGNEITDLGHEREEIGAEEYELRTFQKCHPGGFWEVDEWIGGSPDRLVGENGLLEIKNIISGNVLQELINNNFQPTRKQLNQCHGQMLITGREWVDLLHIHITETGRRIVNIQCIERDETRIKEMLNGLETFKEAVKQEMEKLKQY